MEGLVRPLWPGGEGREERRGRGGVREAFEVGLKALPKRSVLVTMCSWMRLLLSRLFGKTRVASDRAG
jgi:hypothetical protein